MLQMTIDMNREPWLIPLSVRVGILYDATKEGKKINALVYDHADTSTFRYRCYNLLKWTLKSDSWQCVYFYRSEVETLKKMLAYVSLLTLVRYQWDYELEHLIYRARAKGIPIVYDTDDCIFDLDAITQLANSIDVDFSVQGQYDFWFAYIARNGYSAERAQIYSASNAYLGRLLEKKFGRPFYVVRNTLNAEQLLISEKCVEEKLRQRAQTASCGEERPFTIGYFSGSPSHNHDLAMIASELALFLEQHRQAKLFVVGFMSMPFALGEAQARGQIISHPLTDFLELQALIAGVDVNIVPLLENTFTNCKSELKFFEAGIVKTLTLASPIYTYSRCIRDGENGYLCRPGQWYKTLEHVFKNREQQEPVIARAYEDSIENYSGWNVVREMETAFGGALKDAESRSKG